MDRRPNRSLRSPRVRRSVAAGPLAPSDFVAGVSPDSTRSVRVAGRVVQSSAEAVWLADAIAQLVLNGKDLPAMSPGELAIYRGRWDGRELTGVELEWRQAAPVPGGAGDVGRLLFQGVGRALAARSRALQTLRGYFLSAGFLEVETPFRVVAPGVDQNVDAFSASDGYLITSPELEMKRLLVGGVPRQFQFARVSRRDEVGTLHEPEFTLLEWYRAFSGISEVQQDTEALVAAVAAALRGRPELLTPDGRRIDVTPPFERVRVADAFREHAGINDVVDLAASDEARYFELMVSLVEPALARLDRAVFLEGYPISQAALARPEPADPNFAERFELYVGGVELCNGYGELTAAAEQRRRFLLERAVREETGRSVYPLPERFLSALEEGMPPSGGNALGVDRLVQLALGARTLQEVIAFPRAVLDG